ncbi:MAG: CIA30 family protein, partial [Spirochaetales bacterium]|nr:CIA30 family protein [Spirochaetales bacterium]
MIQSKRLSARVLVVSVILAVACGAFAGATEIVLIDDFSGESSLLGTRWEGFTDRVMGGKSDIATGVDRQEEEPFLYLRGNVSLKNNGGFIQVRLLMNENKKPFAAGAYSGLALRVRGRGPGYYVQ